MKRTHAQKEILSLVLAALMLFGMLPIDALAASAQPDSPLVQEDTVAAADVSAEEESSVPELTGEHPEDGDAAQSDVASDSSEEKESKEGQPEDGDAAQSDAASDSSEEKESEEGQPEDSNSADSDAPSEHSAEEDTEEEQKEKTADESGAIEAAILENGYAYVRTSMPGVRLYSASSLRGSQCLGTIVYAKTVLCASAYVQDENGCGAVRVSFAAKEECTTGYVSEKDLENCVLTRSEVVNIINCERMDVTAWLDGENGWPLLETDYAPLNEDAAGKEAGKNEALAQTVSETWSLTDAQSGVSVSLNTDALPEGVTKDNVVLCVRTLSSAEMDELREQLGDAAENAQMVAFDISLVDEATGDEFQPVSGVRVSMPIPEDYTGDLTVYHMEEEGATQLDAEAEDGECCFSTDGFSPFVMLLDTGEEEDISCQTVTAQITWSDLSNRFEKRPTVEELGDVVLYYGDADDKRIAVVTENEDGSFTAVWEDVPSVYNGKEVGVYSIEEPGLPPVYTMTVSGNGTSYKVANNLRYKSFSTYLSPNTLINDVIAKKAGVTLPKSVTVTLLIDDVPAEVDGETVTHVFYPNEDGSWGSQNFTFALLTVDDSGNPIDAANGKLSAAWSDEFDKLTSFVVSQTVYSSSSSKEISYRYVNIASYYSSINWDDDKNAMGVRPNSMTVRLLANGVQVPNVPETTWSKTSTLVVYPSEWTKLPQLDADGKPIRYSVQVDGVPAYYTLTFMETPGFDETTGYTIYDSVNLYKTPTFTLDKTQTAKATVYWEGDVGTETETKNRPQNVLLTLFSSTDGGNTWTEFWGTPTWTVTAGNNPNEWTYEWSNLPSVDADGNPMLYKVEQNDLSIYTTTVDAPKVTTKDGVSHTEFVVHNAYNDNWNYYVDMAWNVDKPTEKYAIEKVTTSTSSLTAQYYLTIGTQKEYEANQLEVRIPYELFNARTGNTGTVFSDVSLGDSENHSPSYNFTYRIDTKGTDDTSDDEIVFYNYRPLAASDNTTITVEYKIDPTKVVDCSTKVLQATATGQYVGQAGKEVLQPPAISYRLDTGLCQYNTYKGFFERMYFWNTSYYGTQPEDFDLTRYNYVSYRVQTAIGCNQPSDITFTDIPHDGGEIVRVRSGNPTNPHSDSESYTKEFTTAEDGSASWTITKLPDLDGLDEGFYFYVVVRYPRVTQETDGEIKTIYHNDLRVTATAKDTHDKDKDENFDFNDLSVQTSAKQIEWKDYVFTYTGEIVSDDKSLSSFPGAGITLLTYGNDIRTSFSYSMTVNGYNLADGYHLDMYDDAMYAYATIDGENTDYVRLTEQDIELVGYPTVQISSSAIDRTNGQAMIGMVTEEPFTLWGRRSIDGAWEELGKVPMNKSGSTTYYSLDYDLTGRGYVATRVTSPEGLMDKFYVYSSSSFILKASSPLVKGWLEQGEVTYINVRNFAGFKLFEEDGAGGEVWFNALDMSNTTYAETVGLDALDVAAEGSHVERKTASASITPVEEYSRIDKGVYSGPTNDVANELVNVQFSIAAYQAMTTDSLPEEIYESWSMDDGVFYDLLPSGFSYNPSMGVTVYGANAGLYSSGSINLNWGDKKAALESVQTIEDYKGTGRQMVIFRVKSMEAPGRNYRGRYTGFGIYYWAQAGYDDVTSGVQVYNSVAFQRGDDRSMNGAYTERGYGGSADKRYFPETEDGERVFYDVNGDGVVDENKTDTLYAYKAVTPSFIQTVQNGLSKLVKAKAGYYKRDDVVDLGADYTYRLRLQTSDNSITKNVVIYDILENAVNTGGTSGELGYWRGSFISASARSARNLGIDPVVWYSTAKNLSYNDESSLLIENVPGIWSNTPPDDPSTVTAVAFDLRYSDVAEGTEFVFEGAQVVELFISMVAPDSLQDFEYAYNRPAYNSTFRASNMPEENAMTSLNIASRTTLALHDLQDFSFVKQYVEESIDGAPGERKPLSGVTFKLYRCTNEDADHTHTGLPGNSSSCWGGTAIYTATSNAYGKVEFRNLETGKYAFVESSTRTGFSQLSNRYWTFEVNAQKGTVTAPVAYSSDPSPYPPVEMQWNEAQGEAEGYYSLLNDRPTKTLGLMKYWDDDTSTRVIRPASVTFDLFRNTGADPYKDGDTPYRTVTVDTTTTSSSISYRSLFKDLYVYDVLGNYYIYTIKERPVAGYAADGNGIVTVPASTGDSSNSKVYNRRLGILELKKLVPENAEPDLSFGFRVKLMDDADTPLAAEDANGNPITYVVRRFDADGTAAADETVTLQQGGVVEVSLKHGERLLLLGLPVGVKYTVSENETVGYTSQVTAGSADGTTSKTEVGTVTFTNTRATISVSGTKTWNDEDDLAGIRPAQITVRLLADGTEVRSAVVEPDVNGDWKWEFKDVPEYASGKRITYTVAEDEVTGYTASVSGCSITNTITPVEISGTKTWVDGDNRDGIRPDQITVRLLANGTEVRSVVVEPDEDGKWAWKFENMPGYAEGLKIVYTVTEDAVNGYTTSVDGYNITNTHTPSERNDSFPRTGDNRLVPFYEAAMALSFLAMVLMAFGWRKRRKED